jgi:putative secretion ATPase (PEP-CTERM system associated)
MYESFFKLTAEPFRLSPDHHFCYNHAHYAKAKAYMAYAFMRAEGFVMVTGAPGTGKTTLIGDLVESLAGENVVVAKLVSTQLAADDLLRMVAFTFGISTEVVDKSSILQQLNARFLRLHREGGRALLIVDEAQDLNPEAMEELRLLTNLQQDGKPLLQIFLLGQPELRDMIHDQRLTQVHQRIIATSHLTALEEDETRAYVEHRLNVVGWKNDPAISSAVFPIIFQFSEGIPRRINLICSRLFLHSFVESRHQIGVADARTVVQELQEEQLSTRNLLNGDLFYAEDVYDSSLPKEDLLADTSSKSEAFSDARESQESGQVSAITAGDSHRHIYQAEVNALSAIVPAQGHQSEAGVAIEPGGIDDESGQAVTCGLAQHTSTVRGEDVAAIRPDKAFNDRRPSLPQAADGAPGSGAWAVLWGVLAAAGIMAVFVGVARFV